MVEKNALLVSEPAVRTDVLPATGCKIPPECYVNRELSWLSFNERVLEELQKIAKTYQKRYIDRKMKSLEMLSLL